MILVSASVQTRKTRVMRMIWVFGFFIIIIINCVFCAEKPKVTRNVEITADDEKLRDPAGYAAIKELHGLMDDDQSGSIDRFESTDFLQEDLKLTGNDRTRRERAFHHDDDSITVDDMWESWFESEERAWDEKTISNWLVHVVKLPQYEKNFIEKKVSGIALPRIAIQNSSYLSTVLGIKNFVHRQKLQLKALDLVLFGFHEIPQSRIKDIAVAVMTIACLILGYLLTQSHKKSKQQVEELSKKLSEISSMENDLEGSNKKFDKNAVEDLQKKLEQARRELEESGSEGLSYSLQPLLRHTYQMEISCINEKKMECMREMKEAKEFVDRMRRNKLGFVNSLKLATGSTAAGTDAVDAKVYSLKQRMEKIKATMEECHIRWVEIESLCGFTITGYGPVSPTSPTSNGKLISAISSPKLSANGSRKSSPPSIRPAQTYQSSMYVSSNNNSTFPSDTPPSTINSLNSTHLKSELSALKREQQKKNPQLSDDTNSLSSSKSSSSITKRFKKMFSNERIKT